MFTVFRSDFIDEDQYIIQIDRTEVVQVLT